VRKIIVMGIAFAAMGGLIFTAGKSAPTEAEVLEELLALETATLDGWYNESDPTLYAELFADTATYFDPWAGGRIEDGEVKEYLMTFMGKVPRLKYEIPNPRVDLYGDTAVFTFNEKTTSPKDGSIVRWNVTLVFTRTRDGWKRVHANWAYAEPPGS
jgi:hypothetical protein